MVIDELQAVTAELDYALGDRAESAPTLGTLIDVAGRDPDSRL